MSSRSHGSVATIDVHSLSKQYPLRQEHYLWMASHATVGSYYIAQRFALYFLFVKTSAGCSFKHSLALMMMMSIFCETLVIPLTGYVCDRCKRWNPQLLVVSMLLNLALSLALYAAFLRSWCSSVRLLMGVNIAQTLISMQFNNSLFKLTKLFMQRDTADKDAAAAGHREVQLTYFTRIGIWGRFSMQLMVAALVGPVLCIMKTRYWSFESVLLLFCAAVLLFGGVTLALSIKIALLFRRNPQYFLVKDAHREFLINSASTASVDSTRGLCA